MAEVYNWQLGRDMSYRFDASPPEWQFAAIFNINRCLACQTCSLACKSTWTFSEGQEDMWWNNVETKPYGGYPHHWDVKTLDLIEQANPGGQTWSGSPDPDACRAGGGGAQQFGAHASRPRDVASLMAAAKQPVVVSGIEHKLQQVLLNLCLNAKDAMPKGGWLSIATRADGARVVIEVSDTGSGIPAEYLARIYDPFFTTKQIGQGTGLGLSITYGIVREHDGTIDCESSVEQGTRFVIGLPAVSAAAHAPRAARR